MTIDVYGVERAFVNNSSKKRPTREGGWRNYYYFDFNLRFKGEDIELLNMTWLDLVSPEGARCGFPQFKDKPSILIKKKDRSSGFLDMTPAPEAKSFVSDRLKALIEAIDPQACAFVECNVQLQDGGPPPKYWICDVVQIVDAFDESYSSFHKARHPGGDWTYSIGPPSPIYVDEDRVGNAHLFRLKLPNGRESLRIICDETVRAACRNMEAVMTGVDFQRIDRA